MKYSPAFISIIILLSGLSSSGAERSPLEVSLEKFSAEHGEIGVLILDTKDAGIRFIYNEPLVAAQRFPVGSVMKPLSAAVMLDYNGADGFNAVVPVQCSGKFYPPASSGFESSDKNLFNIIKDEKGMYYFKCSVRKGHGSVSFEDALNRSCNVYFLTKASLMNGFYEALVSSWDLLSDPVTGSSLSRDAYTPFQKILAGIGEGSERITMLKLAQCYNSLFTGAPLLVPGRGGKRTVLRDVSVSRNSRERITAILAGVTRYGTLKEISVANHDVRILASKTGTATPYKKKTGNHGLNVILFENKNEKLLLVTFVMKGSGSKEAARLSECVLNGWMPDQ